MYRPNAQLTAKFFRESLCAFFFSSFWSLSLFLSARFDRKTYTFNKGRVKVDDGFFALFFSFLTTNRNGNQSKLMTYHFLLLFFLQENGFYAIHSRSMKQTKKKMYELDINKTIAKCKESVQRIVQ